MKIETALKNMRTAGLLEEAKLLAVLYSAWMKTTNAYVSALSDMHESDMASTHELAIVNYTINFWGPHIEGTQSLPSYYYRDMSGEEATIRLLKDLSKGLT